MEQNAAVFHLHGRADNKRWGCGKIESTGKSVAHLLIFSLFDGIHKVCRLLIYHSACWHWLGISCKSWTLSLQKPRTLSMRSLWSHPSENLSQSPNSQGRTCHIWQSDPVQLVQQSCYCGFRTFCVCVDAGSACGHALCSLMPPQFLFFFFLRRDNTGPWLVRVFLCGISPCSFHANTIKRGLEWTHPHRKSLPFTLTLTAPELLPSNLYPPISRWPWNVSRYD